MLDKKKKRKKLFIFYLFTEFLGISAVACCLSDDS